jgi:hypothetical protein
MKTMARAACFLLLCLFCAFAFAQPAGRGVIWGTVIDLATGDPVRHAIVTATWHGTPRAWATTRSDASGRFLFEGLPSGNYELRATKASLGIANYGAKSVRELGEMLPLADGETRADIQLQFIRSASISGRVLDTDGDPVPNAFVNLFRASRTLGERSLANYRGANTNDRGEYKISPVDPGEYYLHCDAGNQPRMGPETKVSRDILASQFYGGASDAKNAPPLNLRGGESLTGMDFHLVTEHTAVITGRVTGVPPLDAPSAPIEGRPVRGNRNDAVSIQLSPADNTQMNGGSGGVALGPDYHFELPETIPARYLLQATVGARGKMYHAEQIVDAQPGTTDVLLTLAPEVDVKGSLKMEGPGAQQAQGATVVLATAGGSRRETHVGHVGKDGSFKIENVPPGEWVVNINPSPLGTFQKSVRLGDKDYLYKKIEIPPGSDAPLNVVVSSNTATIEGEVDAGGADVKRAGILLAPVGKMHDLLRFYSSAIPDQAGKFKLTRVAPGKYKIFALEKFAASPYENPESAEALDALGQDLEVAEGANIQFNPKLIPEDRVREILKP